jgi:hypothetical protein
MADVIFQDKPDVKFQDTGDVVWQRDLPTVTTQAVSGVTETSCYGNGTITALGGENATRRGFCYVAGIAGDPTIADSVIYEDGDLDVGAFILQISNLSPGTGYRVRAYAVNSAGVGYGTTVQVTTSNIGAPEVTTDAQSDLAPTSFTANGEITAIGDANATRRGFCYKVGSYDDPNIDDNLVAYNDGDFGAGAFSKAITGLSPGTAYRIRAYAVNPAGIGYGYTVGVILPAILPTVTTEAATAILDKSCTGNGTITDKGGVNAIRRGFCYKAGTSGDPNIDDNSIFYQDDDYGTGAFSLSISGLVAETDYRVRAYATNSVGTSYGTTVQVTTIATINLPTVTTGPPTEVEQISATGNGAITDTGGYNATRRGFCYKVGTSGDPTTVNSVVYDDGDFGAEAFAVIITDIFPGTPYRVRAFAVNPAGISYGTTLQINTPAGLPVVTTQTCTVIGGTSALGNGAITATGGANATRRGFCYFTGIAGDPSLDDNDGIFYDDGDFGAVAYTKSITGLSPGTAYRIRAYATNSAGTSYGITVQLTTLVVAPTVTTQAATNVIHNLATGNGTITNTGGANATRRGFCYKVGTSGDPTTVNSVVYDDGDFGAGAFTKQIISLSPSTGYCVRAYAVTPGGTSYGTTVQVNTLLAPVIPTVTTQAADSVQYNSCMAHGNITNRGNINCTTRGFFYKIGTSGDPVYTDSVVSENGDFGVGAFALLIPGLSPGTDYRVRAFAINAAGAPWGWGTTVQVTTPAIILPTITTQAATDIAGTSITGNGNITATGGANATRRGFCFKPGISRDPTIADSVVYDDGSFGTGAFTKSITGLSSITNYRVRAYAVNSAGISYGTTVQVTTAVNANFIAEKNKRADGPAPINLLTFGFATPVYLSDRDIVPAGGSAHLGLVKTWGFIDTNIVQTPGSGILGVIETTDLQLTIVNSTNPRFSDNFTTTDPPENVIVSLYQFFEPLQYGEKELIFKGQIYGQPQYDEYTCTLTIRGIFEKYNRKIGEDKIITAAAYPDADPDDIGKMENIGYGDLRDVPCRALKAGTIDTLRDDLSATAQNFYVSGDTVADFPPGVPLVVQIDDELIYCFYDASTQQFYWCARGFYSFPAAHDKGSQVAEVLSEYIYEVFGHPAHHLGDVRVDGIKQTTGFIAYTGQAGSVLAGYEGKAVIKFTTLPIAQKQVNLGVSEGSHSHVSIPTVNALTWGFNSAGKHENWAGAILNESLVCDGSPQSFASLKDDNNSYITLSKTYGSQSGYPTAYRLCMTVLNLNNAGVIFANNLSLSATEIISTNVSNSTVKSPWYSNITSWDQLYNQLYYVWNQTAPWGTSPGSQVAEVWLEVQYATAADVSFSPARGVALTGNSTAETVIGSLVTVDAQGYRDDALGTYTGTPSILIEQPGHVFKHIWAVLLGAPAGDIDDVSFAAAAIFYTANTYKFAKLINEPVQASDLLMRLALQCRSRFIVNGAGNAKLFVRQLAQASAHAIVKNEIKRDSMSIERSPTTEIINLFNINYDLDCAKAMTDPKSYNAALKFTDDTSVMRYGTREWQGQSDLFCFDAVRLAAMAQHVGDFLLDYHQRARKMPHFGVFLDNMEIAVGDIIDLTHPLDAMAGFIVEVQKITHHIGSATQIDWLEILAVENGA